MTGQVSMHRTSVNAPWVTYLPDNSVLDTTGTHTMGMQEGLDWARQYCFNWRLDAGGGTPPPAPIINHGLVVCTRPLMIRTNAVGLIDFGACTLLLQPDNPQDWGIVIDTQDMVSIKHTGQIIYLGDTTAVCEYPQNDNGENFIGSCNNTISLGDIVIADPNTYFPVSDHGVGWRFIPRGHDMVNLTRKGRVNGGIVGVQVDNPTAPGSFEQNIDLTFDCLNQGYASIVVGSGDTTLIRGNVWRFAAAATQRGLVTQAVGDTYIGSIQGPTIGVQEGGSADNNRYIIADNRSATPFFDGSVKHSSRWL